MPKDSCYLYGSADIVLDKNHIRDLKERFYALRGKIMALDVKNDHAELTEEENEKLDSLVREISTVWEKYKGELRKLEDDKRSFIADIDSALSFYDTIDREETELWLRGFTSNGNGV